MDRYCSYQLPYCLGKMVELSEQEVVTIQMGHPVEFPHKRRPFPVCSGASRHGDVEARLGRAHRRPPHRAQGPPHLSRQRNLPLRSVPCIILQ